MKVLVVEDDPVARRLIERTVEELDHAVSVAEDGAEAWTRLEAEPVDVLITDWLMPHVDGLQLVQRLREAPSKLCRYVLLLTARYGREDVVTALRAGVDDVMVKPIDRASLEARLLVAERFVARERELERRIEELERPGSG